MSKTRLTNADRDAIADAIVAHKFDPLGKALLVRENALAEQARRAMAGDYFNTMERAPRGAFCTSNNIRINASGRNLTLDFGGRYPDGVDRRVFYANRYSDGGVVVSGELLDAIIAWSDEAKALKEERRALRQSARATLGNFSSFDTLLEGWPQADRFITAQWRERGTYVSNVPVVAIADLSAKLDLPPEDQAEAA